jgi:CII-binding regulator of phage lambda lysogenization HflD
MKQQLNISSEYFFISSSVDNIDIQSNKDINTYAGGSMVYQTGDPTNKTNIYTINSQNIILGLQSNPILNLEAVPKSDQLIKVLSNMLSIMNDIVNNPSETKAISGDILQISASLNNIKSTITKTY